ncbi:MAG: hypothetical protein B6244_10115 [Candidatus Cloacimonetes bacterium 4572_55]|nr:MAG: hypothetical protein B6244_10115 [Candidatus Cloacimonetes bacterium 4572_55]
MRSGDKAIHVATILLLLSGFVFVSLSGCGKKTEEIKPLSYEGSSTIGEGIMPKAATVFEEKTKIKFSSISLLGSENGFKAVVFGTVDIGGMSRALRKEELQQQPYYQIIGYDAIVIFVNGKNPVCNLSKKQVKGIFTGKITNWKEVGGNDAEIVVVTEIRCGGGRATIEIFRKMALDGADFGVTKEIDKPHDCVKYVAADENSITHASLSFDMVGVETISINNIEPSYGNVKSGSYSLSRPLILLSKELPRGAARQFFDFILTPEGQAIVSEKFMPIRSSKSMSPKHQK